MKKGLVIFSGYNQRAIIAFLRTVAKYNNVSCFIVTASEEDPVYLSEYSKYIFCSRKKKQLDIVELTEILERIKTQNCLDELIVAPSTEALNRFFLENRAAFFLMNVDMPVVDKKLYERISDKDSFYDMCVEWGIEVPGILEKRLNFIEPFVAKPRTYYAPDKKAYSPVLVTNEKEFEIFLNDCNPDFYSYQEYVTGNSFYLLYYFSKDGNVFSFSQENYAQQPGGKSILVAESSELHNDSLSDKYVRMLQNVHYFGMIMIEVRECNGKYYMIEANPRFWGPSQLFVDAGVPFFDYFLKDCGLISDVSASESKKSRYFWRTGFKKEILLSIDEKWYHGVKESVLASLEEWEKCDIYNRPDTIDIFEAEKVKG